MSLLLLCPIFFFILVSEYIPYVFQVLAQMLDLHSTGEVPPEYRNLLPFLFTPAIWQQKGSIPGLVKLLKTFLGRDATQMFAAGQIASVLAVVQQRLIPSKVNDAWGFELIQSVVLNVKPFVKLALVFLECTTTLTVPCVHREDLQQYMKPLVITLLTRMQTSKTDKYTYLFARFILFTMAINVTGMSPDYLITTIEGIQEKQV